jgi:hypothetical protein
MGQYYKALVIGESGNIQILDPHSFDESAKLMAFSWCGNRFVNAVLSLIHNKKAKVAFIGDYAEDSYDASDDSNDSILPREVFMKYYKAAWSGRKKTGMQKSSFTKADMELMDTDTTGKYLVNHDTSEFIDISAYINEAKERDDGVWWAVNPLPLLTACGNGLGGGDFFSENIGFDDVGKWAFAILEYTEHIPEGYEQAHFVFITS